MRFIIPRRITSLQSKRSGRILEASRGATTLENPRGSAYYKMPKETPRRTAVLRILTAAPIWEGCASKKALRGVIIGLPRILSPSPSLCLPVCLFACRASGGRKERNEIRDSDCEGSSFTSLRGAYAVYWSPEATPGPLKSRKERTAGRGRGG